MSTIENYLSPGRHRLVFEEWLSTNRGYTCDSERAKKIMKYLRNEFDGETPNPQFKFMVKKSEYNIVDIKLFKLGLVNRNGINARVNLPVIFLEQIFECLYEVHSIQPNQKCGENDKETRSQAKQENDSVSGWRCSKCPNTQN
jgi:hypothetical protein